MEFNCGNSSENRAVKKSLALSKHSALLVHLFCLVQIEVSNLERVKASYKKKIRCNRYLKTNVQ